MIDILTQEKASPEGSDRKPSKRELK